MSSNIQISQQIILKAEIAELIIQDCWDNSEYVEIGDGAETINIHKSMIDSVIRALAKFNQ